MSLSTKRRILIIDDQESIHQDYRKIITPLETEAGGLADVEAALFGNVVPPQERSESDLYEIDSAFQGEEAVELLRQALREGRPYAVAFVDIRMPPGLDGIQTIRQLWECDPELLVVICSAYSDYAWEDIIRELGRTDRFLVLRKPFEHIEVRQCAAALSERWMIARTDALTELLNRRAFQEQLHREWTYSIRHGLPLCCVMLEIDYFKNINDRLGHSVGDQVLRIIARQILSNKQPGEIVCRYGGEEICLLLPNTSEEEGCRRADALRQAIFQLPLEVDQTAVRLTASFGVSATTGGSLSEIELVDQADAALRQAKQAGRDRVARWSEYGTSADAARVRDYAALFEGVVARDLMTPNVVCARQDMIASQAADVFLTSGMTSLPVVDGEGRLSGVVSETDLLEAAGTESGWSTKVHQLMTTRVIQFEPADSAQAIFDFLCRVQMRRVVIVERERPIGVVSRGSFVRWIRNYLKSQDTAKESLDSRLPLFKAAEALLDRTARLCDEIEADPDDLMQPVVRGVSSIETILGELLRWAGTTRQTQRGDKLVDCK
jgi:diguanylate cyclase (GGDEF)-like protein